ncbi:MAG: ABC transporter substrate-binding protein [Chloroflexia bacterium]
MNDEFAPKPELQVGPNETGLTRRKLLGVSAGAFVAAILAACGGGTATNTTAPASSAPASSAAASSAAAASARPSTAAASAPASSAAASSAAGASSAPASSGGASGGTSAALQPLPSAPATPKKGEFHGAWPYSVPPKGHYNSAKGVTDGIFAGGIYRDLLEMPLGMYYWASKKWMPLLATDWKYDGDNFKVTLRQGAKWSDGKDFTSKDVVTTFWILRIMRQPIWNFIDKVEADGNNAVTFHMSKPATVVERYIIRENIKSDATFGEWAKKAQDLFAAGKNDQSDEFKQLNQEFQQARPKEMIVSGPFKIDQASMTNSRVDLVKVPTSWAANYVNFDKIVLFNGETPDVTPVVLAKDVDYATHGFPPATEQAFQQAGIRVGRPPVFNGGAILFNYDKMGNVVSDKKVRQALAMAINRDQNAKITYADSGKGVKAPTNIAESWLADWMSAADIAKLNLYPYDTAKAESMLKELGWTKGGDNVWVTKEGVRCDFEILAPAEFADSSASAQDAADQLTKFGFKTALRTVTFTQVDSDIDKGNFQMVLRGWGTSDHPFPQFAFDGNLIRYTIRSANGGGKGMAWPLKQKTDSVGDVDFEQLTTEMGAGLDVTKQKEVVTKAIKAFNELLPLIPLYERFGNNPILEGVRVVGWPKDDDPIFKNAAYADSYVIMSMLEGKLQPK